MATPPPRNDSEVLTSEGLQKSKEKVLQASKNSGRTVI